MHGDTVFVYELRVRVFFAFRVCVCVRASVCGRGPLAPLTGRSLAVRLESQRAEPWGFTGVVR